MTYDHRINWEAASRALTASCSVWQKHESYSAHSRRRTESSPGLEVTLRIVIPSARRGGALIAVGALTLTSAACASKSSTPAAGSSTTAGAASGSAATTAS